jgi:hypothetical protein
MTKLEILDILDKVFVAYSIQVEPRSKFSVIDIHETGLRFYTYSDDSSKSDCVWYCGVWIVSESKEIRIPNEMPKEFIEETRSYSRYEIKNDIR